jgi:hypothetical protein
MFITIKSVWNITLFKVSVNKIITVDKNEEFISEIISTLV